MNEALNNTSTEKKDFISIPSFLSILAGLVAVFSAVFFLHLEEDLNLVTIIAISSIGFCVYAFIPLNYKLPFLFGLNIIAIITLLGVLNGFMFLASALFLFFILNLPVSVRIRTILLLATGFVLALIRIKYIPIPVSSIILPILGGLFMFRSILFLYEQKFAKKQESLWMKLNYFFMLPNLIFVIFPVVDYKIFVNSLYAKPAYENYRKGILWMVNGIIHLFFYRIIYYYLVPNPFDIDNVYGWLQYVITSYALIIRLAGIFHLSAGIMCLFGFNLPPTFNNYFFSNSFNDLWRRINIYWKDFVMKVFYYPVYFKVKKAGTVKAVAISILITFAFNWFLHAYQWFWVRGTLLLTIQDVTFWAVFGLTVMLNSVYLAAPRKAKKPHPGFNVINAGILTLRILGIFLLMSLLWSWWTAPSVSSWFDLLKVWNTITMDQGIKIFLCVFTILLLGILIQYLIQKFEKSRLKEITSYNISYFIIIAGILLFSLIGMPAISESIERKFAINIQPVIRTLLNEVDKEIQFKGYYDTMLSGENTLLSSPLIELENEKPDDWKQLHTMDAFVEYDRMITKKLKPNLDIVFKDAHFTTNNEGLRDRPVTIERPEKTVRIALLGGSIEMGTGVSTDSTFENLTEDRLTRDKIFDPFEKAEIINFAVAGTHMPQHLARLDEDVTRFQPQVVIYVAHSDEVKRILNALYGLYHDLGEVDYDYVNKFFDELDLDPDVDEGSFKRAARPKIMEFITWGFAHMKETCDSIGAVPVWMFVPSIDGRYTPDQDKILKELAIKSGFYIINLEGFRGNVSEAELRLRPWDYHPNAKGHKMLSQKMYEEIISNSEMVNKIIETYSETEK